MNKDQLKETLKNHRNTQTHLWTGMLVTISGTLVMLQSFEVFLNKILFITGILSFIFLFGVYLNKNEQIIKLTKKLKENSEEKK